MNSASKQKKSLNIALIVDERLTRERRGVLSRVVTAMRAYANVQVLSASAAGEMDEEQLVWKIQKEPFHLVLAPWYRYVEWSKVEAHFGLTRSSGPTFAGYFCDPIDPHEIGAQAKHQRAMVFDFAETHPHEAALLVRSLADEARRTGIRSLLDPATTVYCENWYHAQGQGSRVDAVMSLPEIDRGAWQSRSSSIRLILSALWSLVYEEGSGKSELNQALSGGKTARAYLQVGCDAKTFAFRLCYSMPGSTAKGALASFWPDASRPTAASQLLLKYADFLRVHTVSDGQEIELTTGLFQSAACEKAHRRLHTLWIEPVSAQLITEVPFESPGPDDHHLKALPIQSADRTRGIAAEGDDKSKDKFLFEAAIKIRDLKKQIAERDELISELKSGGVGTAVPVPPPDAEGLIEAFQQKYFEARHEIRQFEHQIADMERNGATPQEVEALRLKMAALARRQEDWIRRLATTLHSYKTDRKQRAGGGG